MRSGSRSTGDGCACRSVPCRRHGRGVRQSRRLRPRATRPARAVVSPGPSAATSTWIPRRPDGGSAWQPVGHRAPARLCSTTSPAAAAALITLGQPVDLLGEDPLGTARVQAPEPAHQPPDHHLPTADSVVSQPASVATVHPARQLAAHRAPGRPSTGRGIEPDHPVDRDHIVNANAFKCGNNRWSNLPAALSKITNRY